MGGGEVVKKGYLTKSPPLDGKMKVRLFVYTKELCRRVTQCEFVG